MFLAAALVIVLSAIGCSQYAPPAGVYVYQCASNWQLMCCPSAYYNATASMIQRPCALMKTTAVTNCSYAQCVSGMQFVDPDQLRTNPVSASQQAVYVISIIGIVAGGIVAFLSLFVCGWKGIR